MKRPKPPPPPWILKSAGKGVSTRFEDRLTLLDLDLAQIARKERPRLSRIDRAWFEALDDYERRGATERLIELLCGVGGVPAHGDIRALVAPLRSAGEMTPAVRRALADLLKRHAMQPTPEDGVGKREPPKSGVAKRRFGRPSKPTYLLNVSEIAKVLRDGKAPKPRPKKKTIKT